MKTAEKFAQELYDQMKGFRVTNKHRKKCALVCIDQLIKNSFPQAIITYIALDEPVEFKCSEFLIEVKKHIENIPV